MMGKERFYIFEDDVRGNFGEVDKPLKNTEIVDLLNELNELNEELNKQVNNYLLTIQSLIKTNLSLNNQLAETQKELREFYKILFPMPDEAEHLNCRCSYEPNE